MDIQYDIRKNTVTGNNNRVPRWTVLDPWKPEVRSERGVSCLASRINRRGTENRYMYIRVQCNARLQVLMAFSLTLLFYLVNKREAHLSTILKGQKILMKTSNKNTCTFSYYEVRIKNTVQQPKQTKEKLCSGKKEGQIATALSDILTSFINKICQPVISFATDRTV